MTKEERARVKAEGKTILRPKYDSFHSCWKIAQYTPKGGWKFYSESRYTSATSALFTIDRMIEMNPELYVKED